MYQIDELFESLQYAPESFRKYCKFSQCHLVESTKIRPPTYGNIELVRPSAHNLSSNSCWYSISRVLSSLIRIENVIR